MKILLLFFSLFFLFSIPCFSQTSSLVSGTILASNPTLTPCPSGQVRSFQYFGIDTEIHGVADPSFSGGMMSECYGDSCCKYGMGFIIRDTFIGNNNFRYISGPVKVNGTTYGSVLFRGSLLVNGVIRIPFYLRKKQTAILTGKVTLSGYLNVYLSLIDLNANNPFYSKTISDPNAIAIIAIQPRQGNPTRFDVTSLKYEFVNTN